MSERVVIGCMPSWYRMGYYYCILCVALYKISPLSSSSYFSVATKANNNSGTAIIVTISDTGRGIDPLIENRLFEKFVSLSENGAGIGLYLSRKIIEAHGGRIWAENNNNKDGEKGATFRFSLPLNKQQQ